MRTALGLVGAAVVLASCGGEDELRGVGEGLVACDADAVRISFDPAESVEVTSGGRTLALATFTERRVNADCRDAPGTDVRRDDRLDRSGVYRRTELECRFRSAMHVRVNPIFNADVGRNDGSSLLVLDGDFVVAAVVLKNRGDPQASRIYRAPESCSDA